MQLAEIKIFGFVVYNKNIGSIEEVKQICPNIFPKVSMECHEGEVVPLVVCFVLYDINCMH